MIDKENGKTETKKETSVGTPVSSANKPKIDLPQIVGAFIVGAILGIAGTLYFQGREIEYLKAQLENLKSSPVNTVPTDPEIKIKAKPEELIKIIEDQQRGHVKQSCGEFGYQNFGQRDLDEFKKKEVSKQIKDELKQNGEFKEVLLAIKRLSPGDQQKLFEQASGTYQRTWAELGKISCEGQTEAGQEAEKIIAGSIVDLVRDNLRQSP